MLTSEQIEVLDKALERQHLRGPAADVYADLPGEAGPIARMVAVATAVGTLPTQPYPDQAQRDAGRGAFLARAAQLAPAAVPTGEPPDLRSRLARRLLRPSSDRTAKETRPMISLLVKAALLLTIIFSSLGGTAILSASALPGSPIYPLKRGLEEVRLYLNDSPADHSALHAAFAQERAKEMAVMAELGRTPSEPHLANFQAHWRQALECAAQLPDSALQTALANARTMADEQETMLAQAGLGARDQIRNHFERATRSLNQVRSAVELGLGDQLAYRWRMQHLPENWPGEGNGPDYSPGKCQGDCDQDGNSYGPDSPEDEHGPYGPGDCQGDCDQDGNSFGPGNPEDEHGPYGPGECQGDCEQDGNSYGPGGPEDEYGPYGPGECQGDCEQDGNSYGPGGPEDEHGPYGPGECQGDCDQDGNSYGPGGPEDEHGPYGPGECQGDCDQEGNNLGPGGPDDEQGSDGPGECQGECEQNSNSNGSGGPDGVSGDNGGADGIGNGGNNEAGGNGPGAGQNGGDGGGNGGSGGSNDSVGNGGGSNKGGGGNKS